MMKVVADTPSAAAADPAHPDHARWVKETTLAMEVRHAEACGGTLRDAEAENNRLLERMDNLAKLRPASSTPKTPRKRVVEELDRRASRAQRQLARQVQIREAKPELTRLQLSPCGRCGTCRRCMRERRVLLIIQRSKEDPFLLALAWELTQTTLDAKGGVGRFVEMSPADANRVVVAKAEDVCDRSVPLLGAWL